MANWRDEFEPLTGTGDDDKVESVAKFTRRVKVLLESGVQVGWIRGEVSNVRRQSSGHTYFVLKDAGAQLSCVLFRGDGARQTVKLQDGKQMLLAGQVSVYEARGQYQLIVRSIKEDGVGRLQREFEALKSKLSAEGLFERDRKRPLPTLPLSVGMVTSPTGAAVQDFIRIMLRRGWRGRFVVLPAKVQGEGAAGEIADRVTAAGESGDFDVLVVGRGGGSLEDLWAFNEEEVVRAIAACPVPVISAVGHEIDFSLSDFVADVRAETPSGAAELLSSLYGEMQERIQNGGERLHQLTVEQWDGGRRLWVGLRDRLKLLTPRGQIDQGWLRRDDMANRLRSALTAELERGRNRLDTVRRALATNPPRKRVEFESHRLLGLWKRLESVSPQSTLNRGFVLMRDQKGEPITRKGGVSQGQTYHAEFADGGVKMEAMEEKHDTVD